MPLYKTTGGTVIPIAHLSSNHQSKFFILPPSIVLFSYSLKWLYSSSPTNRNKDVHVTSTAGVDPLRNKFRHDDKIDSCQTRSTGASSRYSEYVQ